MAKELYRCEPCNFEYEYLYFSAAPRNMQKPIPPCPICKLALVQKEPPATVEDYFYTCHVEDGGCGAALSFELPIGTRPKTMVCPVCRSVAKPNPAGFSIVHGDSTTKGVSVDVLIGRDSDQRWNKIHDRKAIRDKFRQETGSQALNLTVDGKGNVYGKPIQGKLESVVVPEHTVNKDNRQ
jgi:hypothetical protein